LRYVKPAVIDLGALDDVVVIGPDDHDQMKQGADHEVDGAYDRTGPAERPTCAD
jgi:hypothetical protein